MGIFMPQVDGRNLSKLSPVLILILSFDLFDPSLR